MVASFRRDNVPEPTRRAYDISAFGALDAYTEENSLSLRNGSYGYNIQLRGGVLQNTIGVGAPTYKVGESTLTLPSLVPLGDQLKSMHHFRAVGESGSRDKIVAHSVDGKFYKCELLSESDFVPLENAPVVGGKVTFLNYYTGGRDSVIIYHENGASVYDGLTTVNHEEVPKFCDVTMLYERAFGISSERDSIYFSAPLNPVDFSVENGGGEIVIRDDGGKMLRVVSFGGAVYIFKEYGVYRLSVFSSPEDYTLTRIIDSHSKIKGESVAVTPSGMIMLLGRTLQLFDGYKMKELERGLTALMESEEYAVGTYFDDNYFLACKLRTEGEKVGDERDLGITYNNGILCLNLLTGGMGVMRGADVIGLYPVLTGSIKEIFVIYGNARSHRAGRLTTDGKLYGEALEKLWRSAKTNFRNVSDIKILKRLMIDTRHDVDVRVTQGGKGVTRRAYGYSAQATLPFNTSGYDFYFELRAQDDLYVRGVKLIFDFVRRYFP